MLVFAVVYATLGQGNWDEGHPIKDFWSALYFSVVSITTLGFGEIFPSSIVARLLVCAECVLGLVFMGLFLNDISAAQADKVSKIERGKSEAELREKEIRKYKMRYRAMRKTLDLFTSSSYLLTTPMEERKQDIPEDLENHSFAFSDMRDFNQPNLLISQNYMDKTIDVFLRSEKNLYNDLIDILKNTDGDYLDDIHQQIEQIASDIDENDFANAILFQINAKSESGKSIADMASDIIKNSTKENEAAITSDVIHYPYYRIYLMLQRLLPKIAQFKRDSENLIATA